MKCFQPLHPSWNFCGAAVINKGDLIDEQQLKVILEIIHGINPEVSTFVTSYCKVNVKEVVDGLTQNNKEARESSNTVSSRPTTFILKGLETVPYDRLETSLKEIVGDTYRIKGFAETDKGNIEISTVGKKHPFEFVGRSCGTDRNRRDFVRGFKMMSILTKAIREHLQGIVRL